VKPFDQVETKDGRRGVVRAVEGRHVRVIVQSGDEELFDHADLAPVSVGPADEIRSHILGDHQPHGLRLRALLLRHAYRYDLRSGLSSARIEPKLHQVFIASRVTGKLQPRMILADEVGLGKTIEAGLILKELRARGLAERVLIVSPASLQYQWQTELKSKFNEDFEVIDSAGAKYLGSKGSNPFTKRDNVIVSLNFAKLDKQREKITEAPWDLVIVDEAHHVRRSLRGKRIQSTIAYEMVDELKEMVSGLLLLTATPMQLHHFELFSLVDLVEPGLFASFSDFEQRRRDLPRLNALMKRMLDWEALSSSEKSAVFAEHRDLLSSVGVADPGDLEARPETRAQFMDALSERHPLAETMIRNRKSEIEGFAGRSARSILVELTGEELQLFEDIGEYLRNEFDMAMANKQNAIGFLMVTYQKMLASSPAAVLSSFRNRIEKLERQRAKLSPPKKRVTRSVGPMEDLLDTLEDDTLLEEIADDAEWTDQYLETEIARLNMLRERLENLEHDSKAEQLLDALESIWSEHPGEKVVIFTAFKATQDYLRIQIERHLKVGDRRASVSVFNGSLNAEEKEAAIKAFRERSDVLISTEAGGEGRNLQFAHILINYDLPWNPMKVEQRIGRLDRIGQKKTVFVYNLACLGTVEERVLAVLDHRINLFEESVGSLEPILGSFEDDLTKLVMADRSRFNELFQQLEVDIERQTVQARENERLLADFALDRASFRRDEANRILGTAPMAASHDLLAFIDDALEYLGGTLMPHPDGGHVITLSQRLRDRMGVQNTTWHGVFDPTEAIVRDDLDFFALGHPAIEAIIDQVLKERTHTTARADPSLRGGPQLEIIYEIQAGSRRPSGRIVRHFVGADLEVSSSAVEEILTLPLGTQAELPAWAGSALDASESLHRQQLEEIREKARLDHERQRQEEIARAERIMDYRKVRFEDRISREAEWIDEARASQDPKRLKVLPAREGKLRKDRERLVELQDAHRREVDDILARDVVVSGRMLSATLLVPG
jgi:SNF2 family DNA or RNA helicase